MWIEPPVFSKVIFDFTSFCLTSIHLILTEVVETYFGMGLVVQLLHFLYLSIVEHSKQHSVALAIFGFVLNGY